MSEAPSAEDEVLSLLKSALERGTGDLPVLPKAAEEALRLANAKELDLQRVAEIAEGDPPLAARFIGVANSALYYRGVTIRSIQQAVTRLGAQTTRDVLYMAVYGSALFRVPEYHDLVQESFHRSVLVAQFAREFAPKVEADPDIAFLAGLLHEMGRGRCYKLAAKQATLRADREAVIAAVDALYQEAGAQLAIGWKLPDAVVRACREHHSPNDHPVVNLIHHCIPVATYGRAHLRYTAKPGESAPAPDVAIASLQALLGSETDIDSLMESVVATAEGLSGGSLLS